MKVSFTYLTSGYKHLLCATHYAVYQDVMINKTEAVPILKKTSIAWKGQTSSSKKFIIRLVSAMTEKVKDIQERRGTFSRPRSEGLHERYAI